MTWKLKEKEIEFSFSRFPLYEEYEYDYEYDPTLPLDEVSYEIKIPSEMEVAPRYNC